MALFFQEWKKIWRPGILLILVLLGATYYYIFPSFYIRYFCNGPTGQANFDLAAGWVELYGPTMEPDERAELDGQLEDEIRRFNQSLPGIPGAVQAGMTDYETFEALRQAHYGPANQGGTVDMDAERLLYTAMYNSNYYRIKALENYMANYDWKEEVPWDQKEQFSFWSPPQQERILELEQSPRGFLPDGVVESTAEYAKDLAVWVVLSVILLLSPTLVRDRLYRTGAMQWSSRRGRRILNTQLLAGLISALALTAANIAIYAVPFLGKGPLALQSCPLFNWSQSSYTWFNGTYGQYLLVLTALLLILGLAAGALTLFLSQYSGNYVAMLFKAIPLFLVVGAFFGSWLLDRPFFFRPLYDNAPAYLPRGTETVGITVLVILSLALCVRTCRRQRKRELSR